LQLKEVEKMETVVPREKLKELIEKNGDSLFQDRDRCEGLLKDYCAGSRREISAIVGALEERIPLELKSSWQTAMTPEAMRARLVQRLEDNRGLAPEIANYAVDTWSYALGVGLGRSSDRVQDGPVIGQVGGQAPSQNGFAAVPSAAERAAADRPAGSSAPVFQPVAPPPPVPASGGLTTQNKAVIGGAGIFVVAAMAFALMHHPALPTPPASNVTPPAGGQTAPPSGGQAGQQPGGGNATNTVTPPAGGQAAADGGHESSGGSQAAKSATVMPSSTSVVVRLDSDFNSDNSAVGEILPATVVTPLTSEGNVLVPRGASAQLKVVSIDKSGKISGKSHVQFALVGLTAHGKMVHISSSSRQMDGPSQGVRTAERTGIGGAAGAAIGALAGHLFHHAGTGAAAGAGAGGAAGALTSHPAPVKVSAETVLQFRLTKGIPAGS
jgi:hypothetical protein